jgi:hypothetical protein
LEKGEKNLALRKISLLAFVFALVGCASSAYAQNKRGPSTSEERKRAVEMATFLEKNPLAKEAKDYHASLLYFLADVPDIKISLCANVPGESNTDSMSVSWLPNASLFT